MKIPNLIWSGCVVGHDDGSTTEYGHCLATLTRDGTLIVTETWPVRGADGIRKGSTVAERQHQCERASLKTLDSIAAVFEATEIAGATRLGPCTVTLVW